MSNPRWSEAEPGARHPPEIRALERRHMNQHQQCSTKTKKGLAYVSSIAAVCQHCDSVAPPGLWSCGRRYPRFRSASHSSTWGYSWYCLSEANRRANPRRERQCESVQSGICPPPDALEEQVLVHNGHNGHNGRQHLLARRPYRPYCPYCP